MLEADYRTARFLHQIWEGEREPPAWVTELSRLYRLLMERRRRKALARREPVEGSLVVGVGNLTVGGSGKTPMTVALARELSLRGKRVAILVRRLRGALDPAGDEYHMLRAIFPEATVEAVRNKERAVRRLAQDHDAVVIDDAFQVWSVKKDLELVMLSVRHARLAEPRLLPAGPFRELPDALERADLLVISGSETQSELADWVREAGVPLVSVSYQPLEPLTFRRAFQHLLIGNYHMLRANLGEFVGSERPRDVVAFAGIANPFGFFKMLARLMPEVKVHGFAFSDHFHYRRIHFHELSHVAVGKLIYTTEKDFFRILAENGGLEQDPPAEWYDLLDQIGHWQFIPVELKLPGEVLKRLP